VQTLQPQDRVVSASRVVRSQATIFRLRNVLAGLPLAAILLELLFARRVSTGPKYIATGVTLAMLGGTLRAWGTLHNRYAQGDRKTLAIRGPYSWVRNPLYVANTLVIVGAAIASGQLWAAPITLAWCGLVYAQVVQHEERRLLEKYGAEYAAYRAQVGAWWPRALGDRPPFGAPLFEALFLQSRVLLVPLCLAIEACILRH
jgi:protein-S-isoprenylcysteine O-methyltransferase Ste14